MTAKKQEHPTEGALRDETMPAMRDITPPLLSDVMPSAHCRFTNRTIGRRAAHGAIIMEIIALRSLIETQMVNVILHYTDDPSPSEVMRNIVDNVRSYDAREKMAQKQAKSVLNADMLELFIATTKAVEFTLAPRNNFAHGSFGFSDDLPDDILWLHQTASYEFEAEKLELNLAEKAGTKPPEHRHLWFAPEDALKRTPLHPPNKINVYSLKALESLRASFRQAPAMVMDLRKLRLPHRRAEQDAITRLTGVPAVREILETRSRARAMAQRQARRAARRQRTDPA